MSNGEDKLNRPTKKFASIRSFLSFDPRSTLGSSQDRGRLPTSFSPQSGSISLQWHIMCLVIHIFLTTLHLAMILVMRIGLERRVKVQFGSQSDVLSLVIQIFLQLFTIIVLTATLFVTQKVFMHRLLTKHQSLTRSHDQYSSWLGLASAIAVLFKQRSATSGLKWIIFIVFYLAASAALKITTAALFQLSPTTIVVPTEVQTATRTSDFLGSVMRGSTLGSQGDSMVQYLREAMILEYSRLGTWEGSPTVDSVGLKGNVLYDIIPSMVNATGAAYVTSTTLKADCQPLSTVDFLNLTITTSIGGNGIAETQNGWMLTPLSVSGDLRERNGSQTAPPSFHIPFQSMYRIDDSQVIPLNFTPLSQILIDNSTSPIPVYIDDPSALAFRKKTDNLVKCPQDLHLGASVPFNPGPQRVWWDNVAQESGIGLMICSVTWTSGFEVVDAQQRTLVNGNTRKHQSFWGELSPEISSLPKTGSSPIFNSLGKPPGQGRFDFACNLTSVSVQNWSTDWTFFDVFADKYLGLTKQETPRIQLYEFENMLEEWIAMNLYIYNKVNAIVNFTGASSDISRTVLVRMQVSELQLRALPVFAGFAASLIMLFIACVIVFTTPGFRFHPNEIGLLQLLWLSDVKFDLGPEVLPTEANLRNAGLTTSLSLLHGVGGFRRTTQPV